MSVRFTNPVKLIGAGLSIGQTKSGVNYASEILKAEKIEKLVSSNANWVDLVKEPLYLTESLRQSPIRNINDLGKYLKSLYNSITSNINPNDFLLTIGGNHSVASASISAVLKIHNSNLGVIWVDAHGDCNTPNTTPTGNYHGMPLAHLLGLFPSPDALNWGQTNLNLSQVAMIGIRDLDDDEKATMDRIGLLYFTMGEVRDLGIDIVMKKALKHVDPNGSRIIHLSLDVDAFDPSLIPGTGTASPGGLNFEEYRVISSYLRMCGPRFRSMDLVEINLEIEKKITLPNVKEILKITFV